MRRVFLQSILALTAICALGGGARAASSVVGNSYNVIVNTSFGTQFSDCFAFDDAGNLTIPDLATLTYAVNFDDSPYFSAVTPLAVAEVLGGAYTFAGKPKGKAITMIGSDEYGDNYYITGSVGACSAARNNPPSGNNPYRH